MLERSASSRDFNILFTSAGRRVSLIRLFRRALAELKLSGKLVTTDLRRDAPAPFVADAQAIVPRVTEPGYIEALLEICERYAIRLLVPLIDTELHILAEHSDRFARLGVVLLVSSPDVNDICFDKRKTAHFFRKTGLHTPAIFERDAVLSDGSVSFPLLVKPAKGSCSIGVCKVRDRRELSFFTDYVSEAIVQEFVIGEEYTVDVLVSFNSQVRCVVPRLRLETRAGEVSKGMTVKKSEIIAACKKLVEALPGVIGCITIQCFVKPDNQIVFIEINPRFGGGASRSRQKQVLIFPAGSLKWFSDRNRKLN